jgi:hypothetical protein
MSIILLSGRGRLGFVGETGSIVSGMCFAKILAKLIMKLDIMLISLFRAILSISLILNAS